MTTHSFINRRAIASTFMPRRLLIIALLLTLAAANTTSAPQSNSAPKEQTAAPASASASPSNNTGFINGRVVSDEGHPLLNASVFVVPVGVANQANTARRTTTTDEDGNFRVAGLPPGAYYVSAEAKGYVSALNQSAQPRQVYRAGETATLSMIKGGVITGRVTNAAGEPVIAVSVRAYRVRDAEGRAINSLSPRDRQTDDRGVYRLYGLEPGAYVVAANPGGQSGASGSPYNGETPTYFPSATRDTAVEITISSGEERSGADIRYRSERGYAISGTMTGAVESGGPFGRVSVKLVHIPSGALIAQTTVPSNLTGNGFAFYGLTDGEYEVKATREDLAASPPRRVTVKGADATGIQLALVPLGSIAGRLVLEALREADKPPVCADQRRAALEETILIARHDPPPARDDPWQFADTPPEKTLNVKGDFLISALEAGRYRLETKLPGEHWYVRAITLPAAARNQKPIDAARDGFALKVGERLKDLIVTAAEGAASVRGKISVAAGVKRPARLRVYVVPAERERADDVLRYAQVNSNSDGSFTLTNLAPGKYWLLARAIPDDEPNEAALRPAAWDNNERAKLRREAEAAKVEIELRPCQRLTNYTLRYAAAATIDFKEKKFVVPPSGGSFG